LSRKSWYPNLFSRIRSGTITDNVENGYNQNTEEYLKERNLMNNAKQNTHISARCCKTRNTKERADNRSKGNACIVGIEETRYFFLSVCLYKLKVML
jgi:hypothetical protein